MDQFSEALLRSRPNGEGLLPIVMLLLVMSVLLFVILVLLVIVQALFPLSFLYFKITVARLSSSPPSSCRNRRGCAVGGVIFVQGPK